MHRLFRAEAFQAWREGAQLAAARGLLRPPIDDVETYWSQTEKLHGSHMLTRAVVGSCATIRDGLERLVADELMAASAIHDHAARVRSYEILADARRGQDSVRNLA